MTPDQVKRHWGAIRGEYRKVISNYNRSGNRDGNLQTGYSLTTLPIFTSDDRASFINLLHVGYFWALTDETELSDTICQCLTDIGFSSSGGGSSLSTSTSHSP
jgi:hypothetical protein